MGTVIPSNVSTRHGAPVPVVPVISVDRSGNYTGVDASSGVTPVTGTFTGTGQSSSFVPLAGRGFNVTLRGTFVASVQLERSFDDGTNWVQASASRSAPDTFICDEPETGVSYRLNCTAYTSGTVTYRISQ